MKTLSLLTLILFSALSYGQAPKIHFDYDAAGNQIKRELCLLCSARQSEPVKDISELKESDLSKFFPSDDLSYYPNPVKEELFLQWKISNENSISEIELFSMNGQLLRSYKISVKSDTMILPFIEQPSGIYLITLSYTNGEQKTIKIIKK